MERTRLAVQGPRYKVGYSHRSRTYSIWDCWLAAPCGLPIGEGKKAEIRRLQFMTGSEAWEWLIKCHEQGLPLELDIPVRSGEEARGILDHLSKGGHWGPWVLVAEPVAA
jgi:hypothetical protein